MEQQQPATLIRHPWLVLAAILSIGIVGKLVHSASRTGFGCSLSDAARSRSDITTIRQALDFYAMMHEGRYPVSIQDLVTPNKDGLRILDGVRPPRDPWNREYVYTRDPVNVLTYGRDGVPGGTGEDADIDNASVATGR